MRNVRQKHRHIATRSHKNTPTHIHRMEMNSAPARGAIAIQTTHTHMHACMLAACERASKRLSDIMPVLLYAVVCFPRTRA